MVARARVACNECGLPMYASLTKPLLTVAAMILQLAMINHNMSYTNNKNGVYKSYNCNILFITMNITIILNSYYKHIPLIRIIYTFNMTGI